MKFRVVILCPGLCHALWVGQPESLRSAYFYVAKLEREYPRNHYRILPNSYPLETLRRAINQFIAFGPPSTKAVADHFAEQPLPGFPTFADAHLHLLN